jgi:fatty-acyl-CoA synthase
LRSAGRLTDLQAVIGVGEILPEGWQSFESVKARSSAVLEVEVRRIFDAVKPDDVAFLLYTSGSTSRPKGVQLVHKGLIENVWRIGERQGATHEDRLWLAVSLFWGYGCSNGMMNMLSHGGCLVLQASFDAAKALALIEAERCTIFYGTPNMAQAMLEHPDFIGRDLSSLRSGTTIGSPEQIKRVAKLGAYKICNIYGLTETYGNSHVTCAESPLDHRLNSVGRPLDGVMQRIVDPETGYECRIGRVGEIRLKGYVTPGYYKNPEATAQALDERGFFRTGDLGYVDENGYLYYRGRLKEIIKTGGMLVSPAEVEAALMKHSGVRMAMVVGIPDAVRDEVLGALIVVAPNQPEPVTAELEALCRENLAAYKVPRRYLCVSEAELPLTTTGKVQKNQLSTKFFAPAN